MTITKPILPVLSLALSLSMSAAGFSGKKVLYVNSYHDGYSWSDGIHASAKAALESQGIEFKSFNLDTYNFKTAEHLEKVCGEAKALIESYKPDVVIVSDDAAVKGLVVPHFLNGTVPFVFCGVNSDCAGYGLPGKNITGMVEVAPIQELAAELMKLAKGEKVGYLASDALTPIKDGEMTQKILGTAFNTRLVKTFDEWKQAFKALQEECDVIVPGINQGIAGWDDAAAAAYVEANTKVPTGSWHDYLNGVAAVSFNKMAAEQGEWAAQAAMKTMSSTSAGDIQVARNGKGELVINARILQAAGITPPFEMLRATAKVIE